MRAFTAVYVGMFVLLLGSATSAQEKATLRYNFKQGETYRYRGHMDSKSTQEMMGQEMKSSTIADMISRMTVDTKDATGTASLIMSLDSLTVASKSPRRDTTMVMTELLGKRSKVLLSTFGEVKGREEIDTIASLNTMRMRGVRGVGTRESYRFHVLPKGEVAVGGTWKATVPDTNSAMGANIIMTTAMTYTLAGKKDVGGVQAFQVTYTGETSLEGKGSMMGSEMYMEGKGKVTGTFTFNPAVGLILTDEMKTEQETTIALTGQQSMTIPMSQSSVITQTLMAK